MRDYRLQGDTGYNHLKLGAAVHASTIGVHFPLPLCTESD